jgi:hypothetical protein
MMGRSRLEGEKHGKKILTAMSGDGVQRQRFLQGEPAQIISGPLRFRSRREKGAVVVLEQANPTRNVGRVPDRLIKTELSTEECPGFRD